MFERVASLESIYTHLNPFMPSGLFYLNSLDQSISSLRGVWSVFIFVMFYRNACN